MLNNKILQDWLQKQDEAFKSEVGINIRKYMCTGCTLKELEELDNRFINNMIGDQND